VQSSYAMVSDRAFLSRFSSPGSSAKQRTHLDAKKLRPTPQSSVEITRRRNSRIIRAEDYNPQPSNLAFVVTWAYRPVPYVGVSFSQLEIQPIKWKQL
jgi:hypothetical protein